MSLSGKIIVLGPGKYGFESISTAYNEPEQIRHVWPLVSLRTHGMSYCRADEAVGKQATCVDGRVSCYLGNGNYVSGELPELGSTKAVILETKPLPRPKCRSETRWYHGRWEKLLRKGWVAA
jgi:hypothetical protein